MSVLCMNAIRSQREMTQLLCWRSTSQKRTLQSPFIRPVLPTDFCLLCSWWWSWFSRQVVSDSCDPMDCGTPGSPVPRILRARILEWVAISFSVLCAYYVPTPGYSHRMLSTIISIITKNVCGTRSVPGQLPLYPWDWQTGIYLSEATEPEALT